jgi:hypothetical protein
MGLRPLACWDCGFESHGYLSVVSVVYCQVEVSATSWLLVQRSPTDCAASLWVIWKPREWGGPGPLGAVEPKYKTKKDCNYPNIIFTDRLRQPHVACYPRCCHPGVIRKTLSCCRYGLLFLEGGGCALLKKLLNVFSAHICTLFDRFLWNLGTEFRRTSCHCGTLKRNRPQHQPDGCANFWGGNIKGLFSKLYEKIYIINMYSLFVPYAMLRCVQRRPVVTTLLSQYIETL